MQPCAQFYYSRCYAKRIEATKKLSAKLALYHEKGKALMHAIYLGDDKKVSKLLQDGADPNYCYAYGYTPLIWAANYGRTEIVKILLFTNRVLIDTVDSAHQTALMHAAYKGHSVIMKLLLNAGANGWIQNRRGFTALRIAFRRGSF